MNIRTTVTRTLLAALLTLPLSAYGQSEKPGGKESSTMTEVMEAGADALQNDEPIDQLSIYLVGFQPMKSDPSHQMIAHHYCHQVNEDFAQCVLFDGNTESANMNGIEYIISEKLFETLPLEEKAYWHPHNYEILSGQLVAPGIPGPVEHKLMAGKMNSYGKTWHVWMTGMFEQPGDKLPLGDPHLAWSFNRDGEDKPGLVAARDKQLGVNTAELKKSREDLVASAKTSVRRRRAEAWARDEAHHGRHREDRELSEGGQCKAVGEVARAHCSCSSVRSPWARQEA